MTENTDVLPDTPTPGSIEQIALQIKSLEQRTTSVTLPRNATVLELKHEIQVAFDVESNRQRLIFQGRVLKDDKSLTDYANLDNGKVIHLVIRPIDAPHNPMNDDPNPGSNTIRHAFNTFNRGGVATGRPRTFPSISSRIPMMEGYAFITLDSNLSDLGDSQSLLSSVVLNGLSAGGAGLAGLNRARPNNNTTNNTSTNNNSTDNQGNANTPPSSNNVRPSGLSRSPFSFSFGRSNSSDFASPLATTPLADRVASGLPFPPSVEVRLARTLGSMRNVRAMLEDSAANDDATTFSSTPNSTPEQLQEIRNRLRNSGNSQSAQIGMVLSELADLMTEAAPRMSEVSQSLRQENQTNEEERNTSRRVLNMSRIVQGMSLINHFLGSVLASADIDSRRPTGTNTTNSTSNTNSPRQTTTLPSFFSTRGNTESIRTSAPSVETSTSITTDTNNNTSNNNNNNNVSAPKPKSTLSNSTSSSSSSSSNSTSRGTKRRLDQSELESEELKKSLKNDKGKEKDKKD